jgi:hypothetical protein
MTTRIGILTLALVAGTIVVCPPTISAQAAAATDSAEFENWRKLQQQDLDGLREKFVSLARAVPADQLSWRPMEGTRSFHDVFAHIAAEGFLEPVYFGVPAPAGSLADFDQEEARLRALPGEELIKTMDRSLENLSKMIGSLPQAKANDPMEFFGTKTYMRGAIGLALGDLHEHLGQLVAYARTNKIVPPWSRRG